MLRALWSAASGMHAQQLQIDNIANNLANVNTNGFKRSRAEFQDLLYQTILAPGAASSSTTRNPAGIQLGLGAKTGSVKKLFSQGDMKKTDNPLDLAIQGHGFLKVLLPDGSVAYTRDGAFGLDGERRLVTPDGRPLADNISLPSNTSTISVGGDGKVYVTVGSASDDQLVGSISLAVFANPAGLVDFITEGGGRIKLQPDHKLVVRADWDSPERRLKGTSSTVRALARLAETAQKAA